MSHSEWSSSLCATYKPSLDTEQIMQAKLAFEQHTGTFGVNIKAYRADNGRFVELGFKTLISRSRQTITYSAVGAHHQNGIIECHIGILSATARTLLIHARYLWPDAISPLLWPYAWKLSEYQHNRFKTKQGSSPINKFSMSTDVSTQEQNESIDINIQHTFGCPVYVMTGPAQSNVLPKWDPRARLGVYLGHSPHHATSTALVLHLETLNVSPQFHVIYDDNFQTITSLAYDAIPPNWRSLCKLNYQ